MLERSMMTVYQEFYLLSEDIGACGCQKQVKRITQSILTNGLIQGSIKCSRNNAGLFVSDQTVKEFRPVSFCSYYFLMISKLTCFRSINRNFYTMKIKTSHPSILSAGRPDEDRKSQGRMISKQLIDKIIQLTDQTQLPLIEKYSIHSILANIEKHQIQIVELFSKYLREGFNLLEFVRFFLNIIPHHQIENLYLTMGLVDLFREISMDTHKERVVLKDITDYMCEKILKSDCSFNSITAKYVPYTRFLAPSSEKKDFLQMPPTIFGETDQKVYKLSSKCVKTDSSKHSRAIIKSEFCIELKKIFILDSLSDSISVYDQHCTLSKKISGNCNKLKKEVIILSFALSKRQYRVGAVLKDFSMKFWDHFNNFEYEKSISTTSICQNLQTNIYFLEYFNRWITTEKTGTIHFWNLLEEKPDKDLKCKYNAHINDVCQIPSLNLLVVVQECKRSSRLLVQTQEKGWENAGTQASVVLYNFYNGHIVTEIDLQGMRIPHTLLYSQTYQVLFMSGLQKKIRIYDLHPIFMDASLKGQLIGHENLITCFSLIKDTPMLVSADDKGKVKLWDFRSYMCLQTIDFNDKTVITNLLDMIDIGKIGVFGSRVNYIEFQDKYAIIKKRNQTEDLKIESIDFDSNLMEIYAFSNKALRVIDLHKGQIKHIFTFKQSPADEQFTSFRYFSCLKKFVLGNSNGEVSIYSSITGQLQSTLRQQHDGAVSFIQFDEFNKIYISVGYDSKILIHRSSDNSMLRQIKNNFNGKEINCFQISVYHNLIAVGNHNTTSVYIWSYEFGKLVGEIQLNQQTPVALHIINGYNLLAIATNKKNIYLFRTTLTSSDFEIQFIDSVQLQKNVVSMFSDLKLEGRGKKTTCQSCKLWVYSEAGEMYEFNISEFVRNETFKLHCKQKSSFNPYREGKQNFTSQLQKLKHTVASVSSPKACTQKRESVFNKLSSLLTEFTSVNLCKLLKLQYSYNVVVGNDKRLKIWNQGHQLLCDLNINYCLPYKWNINPTSKTLVTEKIYYGIKVLETISKKYQNDVSIGESKNLQVKELFNLLQKPEISKSVAKMITEPEEVYCQGPKKEKEAILLQHQYSRKDLHFQLIKRFNFTEVAGPTLKELDNIKKIETLQKEWRVKQIKEEREKEDLMTNIHNKAKRNQEKDHIQFLFMKPKKSIPKEIKIQNEKITNLAKKLNSIENKQTQEKKPHLTTFYKNIYNRFTAKMGDLRSTSQKKLENTKTSQSRMKQSFEDYYREKFGKESEHGDRPKESGYRFRDILTEMNGRVKTMKKCRYKTRQSRQKNQEI